jgi:hypothetical protein
MGKRKPSGCLGLCILAVIGFFWISSLAKTARLPRDPQKANEIPVVRQSKPETNKVLIVREAQEKVRQMLKDPASAKFPGIMSGVDLRSHCHENGDGSYTVKSYVDAATPLGRKRVQFLAQANGSGNSWTISGVQLNE